METNTNNPEPKIKAYDFKRSGKFSKEQLAALSRIHEIFARLSTVSMPLFIQNKDVHVNLLSVDQVTYEDYIRSVPKLPVILVINMDPLPGKALLEIDPNVSSAMLNIIFGGEGVVKEQHELTDIEENIMEGCYIRLLCNVRESWSQIFDLRPRMEAIETNPEHCIIAPPAQTGILAAFKCCIGNIEGRINIYTPYLTLIPIMGKLIKRDPHNFVKISEPESVSGQKMLSHALEEISAPWMVEFGRARKTLKEIQEIKKGDCIKLDRLAESAFDLYVGNIRVGQGEINYPYNDTFGICITFLEEAAPGSTLQCPGDSYNKSSHSNNLDDMNITLSAVLAQGRSPVKMLKNLKEGAALELPHFNGEQMELFAGDIHIGSGEAIVMDDNFGIRITKLER